MVYLEEFANNQQIDLVLMTPAEELRSRSAKALQLEILSRQLLYTSERIDISPGFIAFVNERAIDDTAAIEEEMEQILGRAHFSTLAIGDDTDTGDDDAELPLVQPELGDGAE